MHRLFKPIHVISAFDRLNETVAKNTIYDVIEFVNHFTSGSRVPSFNQIVVSYNRIILQHFVVRGGRECGSPR